MTKTKSLVILSTLIFGLIGVRLTDQTISAQSQKERAPAFTLKLLNGGELKSTDFAGKVAVLKFKASW